MTANEEHIHCVKEVPTTTRQEIDEVISGPDRSLDLLSTACARKAELLVASGQVVVKEECVTGGCIMAFVARDAFSRKRLARSELNQIVIGAKQCCDTGCRYNPDHELTHKAESHEVVAEIIGKNYVPRPMSG